MTSKEKEIILEAFDEVMFKGGYSCNVIYYPYRPSHQKDSEIRSELRQKYADFFSQAPYTTWGEDNDILTQEARLMLLATFFILEEEV